jgi:hypothetical protein
VLECLSEEKMGFGIQGFKEKRKEAQGDGTAIE